MEDIKKQIEEEAKNFHSETACSEIDYFGWDGTLTTIEARCCLSTAEIEAFKAGANFVLQKMEYANRWRKVEEELPEFKGEDYFILCKTNTSEKYLIVLIYDNIDFERYFRIKVITHWKPIN